MNTAESERRSYQWMMEQYETTGNKPMVQRLRAYDIQNDSSKTVMIRYFKSMLRDKAIHEPGIGTTRDMKSVFAGIVVPVIVAERIPRAKSSTDGEQRAHRNKTSLLEELLTTDLSR